MWGKIAPTSSKPKFSAGSQAAKTSDAKSSGGNVIRVPHKDSVAAKKTTARPVDPDLYRSEKVWRTELYVDEVQTWSPRFQRSMS